MFSEFVNLIEENILNQSYSFTIRILIPKYIKKHHAKEIINQLFLCGFSCASNSIREFELYWNNVSNDIKSKSWWFSLNAYNVYIRGINHWLTQINKKLQDSDFDGTLNWLFEFPYNVLDGLNKNLKENNYKIVPKVEWNICINIS